MDGEGQKEKAAERPTEVPSNGAPDAGGPGELATAPTVSVKTLDLRESPTQTERVSAREPSPSPAPTTASPRTGRVGLGPRGRLAVAFLLGVAAMGVVSFFLVRSARRGVALAAAAAAAAATASQAVPASALEPTPAPAAAAEPADIAPAAPPVWRVASLANDPTVQVTQGEVGKRTMLAALGAAGLGKGEVLRVVKAFDSVKSLDHTAPKDTYAFAKDKESGKVVAFEYAVSPLDVWQARDSAGTLEATKLTLPTETRRVAVGVAVGDDLRDSIVKAGLDDDLLKMLDDALEGHAELADLRPGARLRIVATEERVEGAFANYASLDAVEYTPANPSAPKLRVYWFAKAPPAHADPQKGGPRAHAGAFYDAKGQQPFHGGWRSPVPFARIASRFNPHRMHPVLHVVMPHNGVDFAAPPGTPVYASAAGVVKSVGDGGPCGNMVQILHPNGLTSAYCHLSRFAAGLHVGQHVDQRQLVGNVGQTGRATGPHLHFAIKRGEAFLDPLAFKLDGVRVLPPSLRDEFAKTRVDMDLALEAIPMPAPVAGAAAGDGGGGTTDETVFDDSAGLE